MKKYILLIMGLIFLLYSGVYAEDYTKINFKESKKDIPDLTMLMLHFPGVSTSTGLSNDSCTGNLVLAWHMEDLNLANDAGCSTLGDTTWTEDGTVDLVTTDYSDGDYSSRSVAALDIHKLDASQNQPVTEGTIYIDVRFENDWAYDQIFFGFSTTGNYILLYKDGSAGAIDIMVLHQGNGDGANVTISNTNIDYSENKWWRVRYQWDTTKGSQEHQVDVWELTNDDPRVVTGSPITGGPEDNLTAFTTSPVLFRVGNVLNVTDGFWLDRLYMYNTAETL